MNPSDLRSRLDAIKKREEASVSENTSGQPGLNNSGNTSDKVNNNTDQDRKSADHSVRENRKMSDRSGNQKNKREKIPESEKSLLANGWTKKADMVFEKISLCENPLPEKISDFLMPENSKISSLVFYDTETTGLSGGAGNLVFLIGFGFVESAKFKTVQLLLSDFPGEPAFIEALKPYINSDRIYVSYNGKVLIPASLKHALQ